MDRDQVSSPTVTTEAIMITGVIEHFSTILSRTIGPARCATAISHTDSNISV